MSQARACLLARLNKHELFSEPQVVCYSANHGKLALRKLTNYCVTWFLPGPMPSQVAVDEARWTFWDAGDVRLSYYGVRTLSLIHI